MDAKQYINTLSGGIDLIIKCAEEKQYGVTFVEVSKAINMLDIYAMIAEENDSTLLEWMEIEENTPGQLKERWDNRKEIVEDYIKATWQRADEFFKRHGKNPQPTHLKETADAIDKAVNILNKWWQRKARIAKTEDNGQIPTPPNNSKQKHFFVNMTRQKATTILEGLKKAGYVATETATEDWLNAFGFGSGDYKQINWIRHQRRNKEQLSISSLLDFLSIIGVNINTIKDVVEYVFLVKIRPDSYTQFQGKYISEFHEELKSLLC